MDFRLLPVFRPQQCATGARDPKIKAAYEEVANGWFAPAAQVEWLDRERAHSQRHHNKE
jgi:hypothetical protein